MKGQEPAFPTEVGFEKGVPVEAFQTGNNTAQYPGMTKLFYAACAAIQGIMSNQEYLININRFHKETKTDVAVLVAKAGFEIAIAMIEEEERLIKTE